MTALPSDCELTHQNQDICLCTNIDARGRLVEEENFDIAV